MNRSPGLRLGILGGGQLAQMLALAAYPYGILPCIYATGPRDPAAQVSPHLFQGNLKDSEALEAFLRSCDVVTFESEFLDANLLKQLSEKSKTAIYPEPYLMGLLQDRLSQKQLLEKYQIPTAPYSQVSKWTDILQLKSFGSEVVLKQRRFGYDGYGTFFIKLKGGESSFNEVYKKSQEGFIAEKKIPFRRELALLMARDHFGQIVDFPLVESKQTNARCDWVMGPIRHPKEKSLRQALKKLLVKENYIGVIAFELFDTGKDLLVNEVAPRVHNSGHYSQNALTLSQFQAHVLAVTGSKLFTPEILSPFAMANLLGTSNVSPTWSHQLGKNNEAVQLHWYGKQDNRNHRKMGHINTLADTPKAALKMALSARRKVKV